MKLIDADTLEEQGWIMQRTVSVDPKTMEMQIRKPTEFPTIDAVPVVRCRDCKWWKLSEYNTYGIHVCKRFSGVRGESDFCSRPERSEE